MEKVEITPIKDLVLENFIKELSVELKTNFTKTEIESFSTCVWNGRKLKIKEFNSYMFLSSSIGFQLEFIPYSNDTVELFKINVVNRGRGLGSELLSKIMDVSDRTGIKIKLIPIDYDRDENTPKNYLQKLKSWYLEMGFKSTVYSKIDQYYTYYPQTIEYKMVG